MKYRSLQTIHTKSLPLDNLIQSRSLQKTFVNEWIKVFDLLVSSTAE